MRRGDQDERTEKWLIFAAVHKSVHLRFELMKRNLFANQGLEISNQGAAPLYSLTFVAKNTEEQHSQIDHLVQVPGQNAGQNAGQISAEDQGDLQNLHTSTQ